MWSRPARLCSRPPFRRAHPPISDADGRSGLLTPPILSSPPSGWDRKGPCLAGGPYLWDPRSIPRLPGAWGGSGQARRAREGLPSMMRSQPGVWPLCPSVLPPQICLGASARPDPWLPPAQGMQYRCAPRLPTCWRVLPTQRWFSCLQPALGSLSLPLSLSLLRFKPFDETALVGLKIAQR